LKRCRIIIEVVKILVKVTVSQVSTIYRSRGQLLGVGRGWGGETLSGSVLGIFGRLIYCSIFLFRSCWVALERERSLYGRVKKTNLRLFLRYYMESLDGIDQELDKKATDEIHRIF